MKSPQILELSGIGNPEILKKIDVPVLVDLPGVGENVQEHYLTGGVRFGSHQRFPPLLIYELTKLTTELKDDPAFVTSDHLIDPAAAEEERKLQYVPIFEPYHNLLNNRANHKQIGTRLACPRCNKLYACVVGDDLFQGGRNIRFSERGDREET